ncbi:MAG: 2-phospho-L-lactate guanylyltransferase [Candidatus Caldarchaeum sp.]
MRCYAVLPVKKLEDAKTRLRTALSGAERRRLVLRLLVRTGVLCEAAGLEVLVVSSDPDVEKASDKRGWRLVDDSGLGLNPSIRRALKSLTHAPVLIVLPDLPLLSLASIEAVLSIGGGKGCVVCPDLRLKGSNMLYHFDGGNLFPMFGADSYRRHLASLSRRFPTKTYVELGTALDLDKPSDLLLLSRLSPTPV